MNALRVHTTETFGAPPALPGRLPTGTATFLFTDIEGSTQRWDRDRAAMQEALPRHDGILRSAIESSRGHVFKTIGDAFCAVFWTVADALAAALVAQRALGAADFSAVDGVRVRMAIHTGTTDERDADYFGPTVNRVARLLAIAHGGQVIFSNVAASLARPELPACVELHDLGEHRLKDLSATERVFGLVAPDLLADFPKLRSQETYEHNLPNQLTEFIGRERDVAEIGALLEGSRLVTLFGAGGLGKTRCAIEIARDTLGRYDDGAWFVDLAPLADPTLVPNEIAAVFALPQSPTRPMIETVVAHLKTKHLLLIVDNCEHLIADVARAIEAILRGAPGVKILATSRETLRVPGETVRGIAPMAVPDDDDGDWSVERAIGYAAIAFFDARARASLSTFVLAPELVADVIVICRRLDGIPLALELAAARVNVLGVKKIAEKIDERFRVLTGGSRTALKRQQTLRALIDWSYDLLSANERRLFRYLSIFSGSFSLDAATATCASDDLEAFEVFDLLDSLIEKSLVLAETGEGDTRYRLLESIRAYGREKLGDEGEKRAASFAHARAYLDIAETLQAAYDSAPVRSWLVRATAEHENIQAALGWAFGPDGDVPLGQRIAATLRRTLIVFATGEARRWVRTALAAVDATTPPKIAADLELSDCNIAVVLNQHRPALASGEKALAIYEAIDNRRGIANAKRYLGRAHVFLGEIERGEALLRDALEIYRSVNFRQIGGVLRDIAIARSAANDLHGARELFAQAVASFNDGDDPMNVAITAGTLAEAEFRCGEVDGAIRAAEEALEAARSLGRRFLEAGILSNMAAYLAKWGRFDEALGRAREAIALAKRVGSEFFLVTALQHVATIVATRPEPRDGDSLLAARLLGYVEAEFARLETTRDFTEQEGYDSARAALRAQIDDAAYETAFEEGRTWRETRAIEEAARA